MQGKIISSTKELLQACANGGRLTRTYDQHLGKDVWFINTKRGHPVRVLANVARSAERHAFIERAGPLFWQLTALGRDYSTPAHYTVVDNIADMGAKS